MILELLLLIGILILTILLLIGLINFGFLKFLDTISKKIREFIYNNYSFFKLAFIIIFFIEQLLLIILVFYFKSNVDILQLIIGIFALIVITTATLQETFLEIKLKKLEQDKINIIKNNEDILEDLNILLEEIDKIKEENKILKDKL